MATPKKNEGQLSPFAPVNTHITTHNESTGAAIIHSSRPAVFRPYDHDQLAMSVLYTTSRFPAILSGEADVSTHDALMESQNLGLVNPGGTVCRVVDFAPSYECMMHRTQSLDYGIVLEGEVTMVLDSGDTQTMRRGDVAVQRGTMHAWRNESATEWCRMIFVLQECSRVDVRGEQLVEDLGRGAVGLKASAAGHRPGGSVPNENL